MVGKGDRPDDAVVDIACRNSVAGCFYCMELTCEY